MQQLHGPNWRLDLRLFRHGALGSGLPVLLSHELRAVSGLPGEVGAGRPLAATGQEPVEEPRAGGERAPDPSSISAPSSRSWRDHAHHRSPSPGPLLSPQTQPKRLPEPHTAPTAHCRRLVSQPSKHLKAFALQ